MRFLQTLPIYLFLLWCGPALAEPPEYPPDAILTSDFNFQIDHRNDDNWNHAMAKALKSAESFSWPLQKECGDKVVDVRKPGYDPQCELTIQYKTYLKPPGAKDELPYLSFLIWNTDQKTGKVWRRNACRANGEANLLTCIDFDTGRKWLAKAFVSDTKNGAVWKWIGPGGDSSQIEGDD